MQQGIVKWFNNDKGYGFIQCDGKDYFVHFKEIIGEGYKSLGDGDAVTFEHALGTKGHMAKNVVVTKRARP